MSCELAHRPRAKSGAEPVTVDDASSWAAVEQVRQRISAERVFLYVRPPKYARHFAVGAPK
ncbi:hypothetical protein [Clavibacter michiganensis]|uniref:Uncharacterized protein n=1 Tax=Clavibacter michiganensis subsp. insidiosus TaxID=33014 RepID=A0A0D5CI71_9MICO|nr:hypothetical protein [Clavibacter michiganensis]AJW79000.1 hypothetical protein VO01_07530 [Clavibacter michiganensis subsp. insidiosus]AWF98312.1 hypothetical protein BEH61_07310 [Clavibacter michiganensis subsp. insidiosus]AWG01486.1 hypothetical protein BEH62_07760 [Clavibacter michiganensis subsp. insidiosus]OQJ59982.1 hypothetical protein B5P21_08705 [Clavibacter michiganensis subsp. insidiosus]RII88426.1 hypothetical protein DZF92_03185 [Clavibacter michiganensis subsp. insidiosus]